MKIETDFKRIKRLAQERDDENWRFRSFLKQLDMASGELDEVAHRIVEQVTSAIDCTECANCCHEMEPVLNEADVATFCAGLEMPRADFREAYLIEADEPSMYTFHKQPCPFLKDKLCSNYEHRPQDCRSYPHLHKAGFVSRLWGVVANYEVCPIVFNSYERLKAELWHPDGEDEWPY